MCPRVQYSDPIQHGDAPNLWMGLIGCDRMSYYNTLLKGIKTQDILSLLDIIKKSNLNNTNIGLKRLINTEMNLTLSQDMVNDLLQLLTDYKLLMKSENNHYYVDNANVKIWKEYNYNINFYNHWGNDQLKVSFNKKGINLDVPCYY